MMNYFLEKAIERIPDIDEVSIQNCLPSDDPDKQYCYDAAFRDSVASFMLYAKQVKNKDVDGILLDTDDLLGTGYISNSHAARARLRMVAEYLKDLSFKLSSGQSYDVNYGFLNEAILDRFRVIDTNKFDLKKLNQYIEELNFSFNNKNYISCSLLIRAILNYVPPIFGCKTFSEVVSSSSRSVKSILGNLQTIARPIGDLHNHELISRKSKIPTKNQIEPLKVPFEVLIQEIISNLE